MTPSPGTASGTDFVWDSSALHHVGKASRLDVLGSFVRGTDGSPWRHLTTDVVVEELDRYAITTPGWIDVVEATDLDDVLAFTTWTSLMSDGVHDLGEASVAAWAQRHGMVAIIDDGSARAVAGRHGCAAHGSLWLLCRSINAGLVSLPTASNFADEVLAAGAYWPFPRHGFPRWARGKGLLDG